MKKLFASLDKPFNAPCVLAIGMFDGLHKGHAKVLSEAVKLAEKTKSKAGVLTFDPHPSKIVDMGRPSVKMLYDWHERTEMFGRGGAQKVFVKKFDKKFGALTPAQFEKFLKKFFPKLRGVITGANFIFGSGGTGNSETLAQMARKNGWEYIAVGGVEQGGERISSSRLRETLERGSMALYEKLAGRPYTAFGKVKKGRQLGRTLGFPTLNIDWNPECKPPLGVYAVRVKSGDAIHAGVANYGIAPTIGTLPSPKLESHLLDGETSLGYGSNIEVELVKFLRGEKKFASLDDLKAQMQKDKADAKKIFRI